MSIVVDSCAYFNSHPRVGGDQHMALHPAILAYFNSHPRVGGDQGLFDHLPDRRISIRTPAWGVTSDDIATVTINIFQFAPPRGG